jgi:hypothetical protein
MLSGILGPAAMSQEERLEHRRREPREHDRQPQDPDERDAESRNALRYAGADNRIVSRLSLARLIAAGLLEKLISGRRIACSVWAQTSTASHARHAACLRLDFPSLVRIRAASLTELPLAYTLSLLPTASAVNQANTSSDWHTAARSGAQPPAPARNYRPAGTAVRLAETVCGWNENTSRLAHRHRRATNAHPSFPGCGA